MDEKIGYWIKNMSYLWTEGLDQRSYFLPEGTPVVSEKGLPVPLKGEGKFYLFPTKCGRERGLVRARTIKTAGKKLPKGSVFRRNGITIPSPLPVRRHEFYEILSPKGERFIKAAVPQEFIGKDLRKIKTPLTDIETGETFENLWDLQTRKRFSKLDITRVHLLATAGRGRHRYFWSYFTDQTAKLKAKQISLSLFEFFVL